MKRFVSSLQLFCLVFHVFSSEMLVFIFVTISPRNSCLKIIITDTTCLCVCLDFCLTCFNKDLQNGLSPSTATGKNSKFYREREDYATLATSNQ